MHSVTGTSANDAGWDSDPNSGTPDHNIGDRFELTFSSPGTYTFQCKLHSTVRGTVQVSATPGDPDAEPDPIPRSNVDLIAPHVDGVGLKSRSFGKRGHDASLRDRRAGERRRRVLPAGRAPSRPSASPSPVRRMAALARERWLQPDPDRGPKPPLPASAGPLPRGPAIHRRRQQHGADPPPLVPNPLDAPPGGCSVRVTARPLSGGSGPV